MTLRLILIKKTKKRKPPKKKRGWPELTQTTFSSFEFARDSKTSGIAPRRPETVALLVKPTTTSAVLNLSLTAFKRWRLCCSLPSRERSVIKRVTVVVVVVSFWERESVDRRLRSGKTIWTVDERRRRFLSASKRTRARKEWETERHNHPEKRE